jgi:hypothetical protein
VTHAFIAHGLYHSLDQGHDRVSEFQRNPLKALTEAVEAQVAVLSHNRLIGYFVAPDVFAKLHEALERLEDLQDVELSERWWQEQKK